MPENNTTQVQQQTQEQTTQQEQHRKEQQEQTTQEQQTQESTQQDNKTEEKKDEKLIPKEVVQARINRMYARLKEAQRAAHTVPVVSGGDEDEDEPKPLTREEAEAIWDRKENQRRFSESETRVLMRHPNTLNDDGTFNLNDEFTKLYIDIGKKNPNLAFMVDGPELAEAMVEKQLGIHYKRGAMDATNAQTNATNAHTSSSTVASKGQDIVALSDVEKKIAARMGLTEKDYGEYKKRISNKDRKVRV